MIQEQENISEDRRVKYTKRVIKDALIDLLQRKPVEKISVKELCELADVNRSTFYAHFSDPEDVLHRVEQETYSELTAYISELYIEGEGAAIKILVSVFDYIRKNDGILRVLLSENAAPDFGRSVVRIASDQAAIEWSTRITADSYTLDSAFIFIVNGAIGIIRKWLDDDLDKSSEEMSNLIFSLAFNGLSACMK